MRNKKWYLSFIFTTVLIIGLIVPAYAGTTTYIWAQKNPIASDYFKWLDHTYACVGSYNNCYTSPASASTSGGTPVDGSYGIKEYSECYAFCELSYSNNGVCHQHSNRVLFGTGRTLNNGVRGYSTSKWYWGIYGNDDIGGAYKTGTFTWCLTNTCN